MPAHRPGGAARDVKNLTRYQALERLTIIEFSRISTVESMLYRRVPKALSSLPNISDCRTSHMPALAFSPRPDLTTALRLN